MTAIEKHAGWNPPILIPSDFTWFDATTLLVHQGAVLLKHEGDKGRVIGYTILCTDVLGRMWPDKPVDAATSLDVVITCFGCLGAYEQ